MSKNLKKTVRVVIDYDSDDENVPSYKHCESCHFENEYFKTGETCREIGKEVLKYSIMKFRTSKGIEEGYLCQQHTYERAYNLMMEGSNVSDKLTPNFMDKQLAYCMALDRDEYDCPNELYAVKKESIENKVKKYMDEFISQI